MELKKFEDPLPPTKFVKAIEYF